MTSIRSTWLSRALVSATLLTSLAAAGCGGKSSSDGEAPKADPAGEPAQGPSSEPITAEACEAQGGRIAGDIGDGKIQCNEGEKEVGRVPLGIEGSICCVPAGAPEPTAGAPAGGGGGW